jgi:hypothetical protein
MGFWNVKAKDLEAGDEYRAGFVGAEEFWTVEQAEGLEGGQVLVLFNAGGEQFWDTRQANETMTVRR